MCWSGPLIRLTDGVPAVVVAFWRTFIGAAVLLPFALRSHRAEMRQLGRISWMHTVGTGVILAVHFAAWISSVNLTTVASSALIASSNPVFVAIGSYVLGERLRSRAWLGIVMAVGGGSLVAADGISIAGTGKGELLALIGAAASAAYFLMGRKLRDRLSAVSYSAIVFSVCALVLMVWGIAGGLEFFDHPAGKWAAILAIAAGPQLIGHTTFNHLLPHLGATKVAIAIMGEPVGSALIAGWLFREVPGVWMIPGAALLLAGIALTMTSRPRPEVVPD